MTKIFLFILLLCLIPSILIIGCGGDGDDDDNDDGREVDDDDSDDDATSDDDADDDDADDDDADDDADDDTAPPGDVVATLEVNPICEISCVVTWTTDEAATSWVMFGEDDKGYTYKIGADDPTTDHEVVVVGMHSGETHKLKAVSVTDGGRTIESQELSFTAGDLPSDKYVCDVDVYNSDLVRDGWTITNLAGGSMSTSLTMAIYDMTGEPVWYYTVPNVNGRIDTVISWIKDKYVLVGPGVAEGVKLFAIDLAGNVVWEGPEQPGRGMEDDEALHHVFYLLDDGNYITTANDIRNQIVGDEIRIFDEDLNSVWTWNFWDSGLTPHAGPGGTWTHVNSVSLDYDNDYAYISSYAMEMVYKVDMNTDEVVWAFGDGGDFLQGSSVSDDFWHKGGHGIDYLGDNKLLIYDNGSVNRLYSRAAIYQFDEDAMSASLIWEYHGAGESDEWYNASVGDADLLDNGNILITAGNGAQNQSQSRLIEVTQSGEKVWQMWLYSGMEARYAAFQSSRMPRLAEDID